MNRRLSDAGPALLFLVALQFPGPAEFLSRVTVLKHVFTYPWAGLAGFWWALIALAAGTWLSGLPGVFKLAVECILDPGKNRDAIWDVNAEQDYHEEKNGAS